MGYPMTFKRFVNRNGLGDGDYMVPPERWKHSVNLSDPGLRTDQDEWLLLMAPFWRERIQRYEAEVRFLAGDLRRLERDTEDEGAICTYIAMRTDIEPDVVAAVLKEFITW